MIARTLFLGLCLACAPALGQRIIYVSALAAGANDGASWEDAYTDLQDALDDVRTFGGCPCQIWVAAGVYHPDRATGDRTMAFELLTNVGVYGGFVGGESCLDERDIAANETILSGDLLGDDLPGFPAPSPSNCFVRTRLPGCDDPVCAARVIEVDPDCATQWLIGCVDRAQRLCCEMMRPTRCDNSHNVLRALSADSTVLGGVTVTGGAADGLDPPYSAGGGLYSEDSGFRLESCTFHNNITPIFGSAVYAYRGEPQASHCAFFDNAYRAFESIANDPSVTHCTFLRNRGGGLLLDFPSRKALRNCTFIENEGDSALAIFGAPNVIDCTFLRNRGVIGGAIQSTGYPAVINCSFLGNSATFGGAINSDSIILINCLFSGNRAEAPDYPGFAGAVLSGFGLATVRNCTFVNNYAGEVSGMWVGIAANITNSIFWNNGSPYEHVQIGSNSTTHPVVNYSIIQGLTGYLGGAGNSGVDPLFVDADGADDIAGTEDDDLRLRPNSPALNAGDPTGSLLPAFDLDGHTRILCGRVDMGPYEFGIGDFNCDGRVDLDDYFRGSGCFRGPGVGITFGGCKAFDFNADGAIDLFDFAMFQTIFDPF